MDFLVLKNIFSIFIGFASGTAIAGAIFAFIAAIGVVPRFAALTKTQNKIMFYEDIIVLGGIFGCTDIFFDYTVLIGDFFSVIAAFSMGIFYGCLAVSLAEVLNVIPIFMRRIKLTKGLFFIILSISFGKMLGSLVYFIISGFY